VGWLLHTADELRRKSRRDARRLVEYGRARDRFLLLVAGLAFALLLLLFVLLVGAEHDLGVERKAWSRRLNPSPSSKWERHAEVQPIVVLVLALDDGVCAVSRFRHRGVLL
jgi:hypothetical protein